MDREDRTTEPSRAASARTKYRQEETTLLNSYRSAYPEVKLKGDILDSSLVVFPVPSEFLNMT